MTWPHSGVGLAGHRALVACFVVGTFFVAGCGGRSARSDSDGAREEGGSSGLDTAGAGGSAQMAGSSGAGASRAGAATAGAFSQAGSPGIDEPNISGDWALFGFEDPVGVRLYQNGNALTGYGCCAGLDAEAIPIDCCGAIVGGSIENGRAHFAFNVTETDQYSADVFVSQAGNRMAGSFTGLYGVVVPVKTGWVRIPPNEKWLLSHDDVLRDALKTRGGAYDLNLIEAGDSEFSADRAYRFWLVETERSPLIFGDLGPFWAGEMAWQEAEQTVVVGPVPTTSSELPIALQLHFAGTLLTSIEATLPSGNSYAFSATQH